MGKKGRQRHRVPTVGKVFILLVVIESTVLLGLGIAAWRVVESSATKFYMLLIFLSIVFFVFFAVDAVLQENVYELTAFLFLSLLMCMRTLLGYFAGKNDQDVIETRLFLIGLLVSFLFEGIYFVLSCQIHRSFAWYRLRVGGDMRLNELFRQYQVFSSILKVDIQFCCVGVAVGAAFVFHQADLYISGGVAAISFVWFLSGYIGIRRELPAAMAFFFSLAWLHPTFFIYKIVEFFKDMDRFSHMPRISIIEMAVLATLWRLLFLAATINCRKNFSKGLVEHVFGKEGVFRHGGHRGYGTIQSAIPSAASSVTAECPRLEDVA